MRATDVTENPRSPEIGATFDAIVVGAGFGGMYMLHCLHQQGFTARVYEAGSGVGGTWFWNRYPGARCDVESMQYSYSFSEELDQEWNWSEKYSPQAEILDYANHVADRFDLRRDIQFDTRVTTVTFDESTNRWQVETDQGDQVSAQFCIMAVGCLSAANTPAFEGIDDFKGPIYHTGTWPREGANFTGQRVGVIGTGSSGIQSIPIIAEQAKSLTVFQRTPNYAVPAWNQKMDPEYERCIKEDYPAFRAKARARPVGIYFPFNLKPALEATPEEREEQYEEFWRRGGLPFLGAFGDLLFEKDANETAAVFARQKIHDVVDDPEIANLLSPDNILGCKRLCVDTGYFQTFNQSHVKLVDVSEKPIERLTETGIVTGGVEHELDAVVLATGFAAMTGSFDKIKIIGRDGLPLTKKWEAGPRTYLGLSTVGFPNFFMITGPGSPSVLANMIQSIEQHADWMIDCMSHMRDVEVETIEPKLSNEDDWVDHVNEVAAISLRSTCSSWYVGANMPGRPRVFMPYIGGFPIYVNKCNEVMDNGYEGFAFNKAPVSNVVPKIRRTDRWHVELDMDVLSPAAIATKRIPMI
jgi:cyclohexanone monooxygenase